MVQPGSLTGSPGKYCQLEPGVWQVGYQAGEVQVIYTADLRTSGKITLSVAVSGDVREAAMIVPVLNNDGENRPQLTVAGNGFSAVMQGRCLQVFSDGGPAAIDGQCVNRTGVYDRHRIPMQGKSIKLVFSVK